MSQRVAIADCGVQRAKDEIVNDESDGNEASPFHQRA